MAILVNQPTPAPTAKVSAVGISGLLIAATVGILGSFGILVPAGVSDQASTAVAGTITVISAIQAIVQFAAGYAKKNKVDDVS